MAGATFAIGFLQGLASLGLVRRIDYISAVAGGSRAAAWLGAWLKREGNDPGNVERQLDPSRITEASARRQYLAAGEVVDEEPQPLRHLRPSASPHSAGLGLFSAATLPQILVNLLVHGLVVVPFLMLVITGARFVVALYATFNSLAEIAEGGGFHRWPTGHVDTRVWRERLAILVLAAVVALRIAFSSIARALRESRAVPLAMRAVPTGEVGTGSLDRRIVSSFLVASLLLSFCVRPIARWLYELVEKAWSGPNTGSLFSFRTVVEDALPDLTILSWPNFLVHILVFGGLTAWWASRSAGVRRRGPTAKVRRRIAGRGNEWWVTRGAARVGVPPFA